MNRFVLGTGLALAIAIGSASHANAQYIYGYNTFNPYSGRYGVTTGAFTPYASQTTYNYFNPFTGSSGQRYLYQNISGGAMYQSYGGNPFLGTVYARNYYYPGYMVRPYGYYGYRYFRR